TDRRHSPALVRRLPGNIALADRIYPAPAALASGDLALRRNDQRRAELRVRSVRAKDLPRRAGGAGPEHLAGGLQRRRADPAGYARTLCRGIWRVRFPPRGVLPLLWPGR